MPLLLAVNYVLGYAFEEYSQDSGHSSFLFVRTIIHAFVV